MTAPAPDGSLYVLVSQPNGNVLALLDRSGQPRPGWPVTIADATSCSVLLPAADGSVRLVCLEGDPYAGTSTAVHAYAFEANGRSRGGWPVELACCPDGRIIAGVVGETLTILERSTEGDTAESRVTTVAAGGAVQRGEVMTQTNCCNDVYSVGPDGTVYAVRLDFAEKLSESTSELVAMGPSGLVSGFPIALDGLASPPAFDASGRIHVTVTHLLDDMTYRGRSEVLTFAPDGREVGGGSGVLDLMATDSCDGIEGTCSFPAAPLVGEDGSRFVVEAFFDGTTVMGLNPAGEAMAGWPYEGDGAPQSRGVCPHTDICEGSDLAVPALGPDNVVHLIHRADAEPAGSRLVAIGPDGRVRPGWPVTLTRPRSEVWSVVVGSDGTAYALAIEPEGDDATSATILAIAPDSTIVYTATVVDP